MSEELKDKAEVKKEHDVAAKTQEPPKANEAKPAETAKTAEAKPAVKVEEKAKKARPTNCAVCNKAFKHKHWYYKNGKYFCTKRCWEKFDTETKAKAAEAKAKEAEAKAKEAESKEPPKGPENPAV